MVFGLFKKQISLVEFGQGILQLASGPISSDSARALGMRFENWDGSKGWSVFLEGRGISIPTQKLHFRLWTHCAVQATCTQYGEGQRRTITQSAMEAFSETMDGYDFGSTYKTLEAAYRGQHKFDKRVEPLGDSCATINFLPNQKVGVVNAKDLVETFAIARMPNGAAFLNDFESYSSTVCASIGTIQRAIEHILRSFKL